MTRLPPRPRLSWPDAAMPRSDDLGDVYFSGDGLSEKRAVFLGGCGLPDGWAGQEHFAIGELGFGAGINLLAAWDLWRRHRPSPQAQLSFLSFEGALMRCEDAARVHSAWPELGELSQRLLAAWPDLARGVQRIVLGDGVRLTLCVGDIAEQLPCMDGRIQAWFLDGFAPALNPDMWTVETMRHVARLSAPGAHAATYSVAGDVRRNLEAAGFTIEKKPGHGRKKERLEARLPNCSAAHGVVPPRTAIVIGAGVAGACAARAMMDRGCAVTVIDAADRPGAGASGNPLALAMPRLDAGDSPAARGFIAAWLMARRFWPELGDDAVAILDARHLPRGERERVRFKKLLTDPPLEPSLLAAINPSDPGAGLVHHGAMAVRPDIALLRLLEDATRCFGQRVVSVSLSGDATHVSLASGATLTADCVIVCAGMGDAITGATMPPLEARLGQVEFASSTGAPSAKADGGYCVEALGWLVFGATFEAAPEGEPTVTVAARQENLGVLSRLRPDIDAANLKLASRASVRATTHDRLPFAGPPPDESPDSPIRVIGGLGARGYLWAPLLAEMIASDLFGEPAPIEASTRDALSPGRFALRAARRGIMETD